MDIKDLGSELLKAGAPVLKGILENSIGGIGGKLAGAAIDALAEGLGTSKTPDAVYKKITEDPVGSATVIRQVESEMVRTLDMGTANLDRYIGLLEGDSKQEGVLSRLWRPLFAVVFTFCFAAIVFTSLWLMWTRQLTSLGPNFGDLVGLLTFLVIAGCAVLGIQVWKKTEEKKSGV